MPSIKMTEKLISAVNAYLGEDPIPSLQDSVHKYAGADKDVSKYRRPLQLYNGKDGDGEINFTLYTTGFNSDGEGTFSVSGIYAWRYVDANSNVTSISVSERRSADVPYNRVIIKRNKQKESFNIDDPAKSKMLIAALFGTWEVEPEYLSQHAEEIDALRGQLFDNWQSGVSSIDQYFVRETN